VRIELTLCDDEELKDLLDNLQSAEPPEVPLDLADELTSCILSAMRLADAANLHEVIKDSFWSLPSISDHEQNEHHPKWTVLALLIRSIWEQSIERDPNAARAMVMHWIMLWNQTKYSLFRRLVIHALTVSDLLAPNEAVKLLTDPADQTLWQFDTYREVLRYLNLKAQTIDAASLSTLLAELVKGPPRDLYPKDLPEDDFAKYRERAIGLRLAKLGSGGAILSSDQSKLAAPYAQTTERDEFHSWSSGASWVAPPKAGDFATKDPREVARALSGMTDRWDASGIMTDLGRSHPEQLLKILAELATSGDSREDLWSAALLGLSERSDPAEITMIMTKLLEIFASQPNQLSKVAMGLAYWLQKVGSQ
jgi:hypothetical protein